jgi:hypothetical protein
MRVIWFLTFLCFFVINCSKEEELKTDYEINIGKIINIESLSNISLGQSDTIEITFSGGINGCAHADHLETSAIADTIIFKAYFNYPINPRICTDNIPIHKLKFVFKPSSVGTYTYRSFDTESESITIVD